MIAMSREEKPEKVRPMAFWEAVRLRPGMYVGDKAEMGLHQLVYELLDNAIDESVVGFGKKIQVTIHFDSSVTVADEGRGIPIEIPPSHHRPAAEIILTTMRAGESYDRYSYAYKVKKGLYGVGAACVNILSEWLHLEIRRDGRVHRQSYQTGIPATDLTDNGPTTETGTTISFKPDASVFTTTEFKFERLAERLRLTAFLNKGIEIKLVDERPNNSQELLFCFPNGLSDFVRVLCQAQPTLHAEPIHLAGNLSPTDLIEVALIYTNDPEENVISFANQIPMPNGGTQLSGFQIGLTRALNRYAKTSARKASLEGKDLRAGLIAVIAVTLAEPRFESSTRSKLYSDIKDAVQSFVYRNLMDYFAKQPAIANNIIQHLWHPQSPLSAP